MKENINIETNKKDVVSILLEQQSSVPSKLPDFAWSIRYAS